MFHKFFPKIMLLLRYVETYGTARQDTDECIYAAKNRCNFQGKELKQEDRHS